MAKNLFSPIKLGSYSLPNRIVMAPMTRNRAPGNIPNDLMMTYYGQRSSAGLIVTEASQVSPQGVGYPNTPGIYSQEQVNGWQPITERVHRAGAGRIFLQLWHVGRISHPLFQPDNALPVSASAVAPKGQVFTPQGMKPYEAPRPLETSEIPAIVEAYRKGAENALEAGFDGIEIHGANGYLPDQFLRTGTNKRTDAYGGSAENRARFLIEVTQAAVDVLGPDRVGVHLSPSGTFNDMHDDNPEETFSAAITALDALEIAYIHLVEGTSVDVRHGGKIIPTEVFRPLFQGALIVNSGYNRERGDAVIASGVADMVSFGSSFISNPDLPRRLQIGAETNDPDPTTYYGGGEKGYTDYPALKLT